MYEVVLSRQAVRYLHRLDRSAQQRILVRLEQLAQEPFGALTKPLTNAAGLWSTRIGTWRIVYRVNDDEQLVLVSDIGPHGEIYRRV